LFCLGGEAARLKKKFCLPKAFFLNLPPVIQFLPMKTSSSALTKSARNTAKLVVGGVVAAAGSESINATIVAWDGTPFAISGAQDTDIPIAGYSSSLHVRMQNGGKKNQSQGTIMWRGGAGMTINGANLDDMIGIETTFNTDEGQFSNYSTGEKYWGFSLPSGSTTLYGWMSGSFSGVNEFFATPSFNLTGYAYDDTGTSIKVGAVPEPSAATMALLAGSAALWKRRRTRETTAAA
jgi:hypothetical protein